MVRNRSFAGAARRSVARLGLIVGALLLALFVNGACAFQRQGPLADAAPAAPHFESDAFVSFDGARLGLTTWSPDPEIYPEPWAAIVAVHGMSEYAEAWYLAGPYWAEQGIKVYAFDQRGFGRSPRPGIWAGDALMARDVRAAVAAARAAHPGAIIAVVGQSMGAAVTLVAAGDGSSAPLADRVVVSAPAVRGWSALPWSYRVSLWTAAHTAPGYAPTPPRGIKITASDNYEALLKNGRDPLFLRHTRFDTLYGLVSLMETASRAEPFAPDRMLVLYGDKDELIPPAAMEAFAARLDPQVRTARYPEGWHMLFRDLQAKTVWRDVVAFLHDPCADLPSGVGPVARASPFDRSRCGAASAEE